MHQPDSSNTSFNLAAGFVNNTSRSIFLTGKAGTGKTTFLKHIKAQTSKSTVVVAPTGVAAINAGGVTMHSFFQLPFGPFIPGTHRSNGPDASPGSAYETTDKHSLFKNIRFNADKRQLLQELELLIIDEISMVRCDMLDAMDLILRQFRRQLQLPFGGVQVLYIGDMYQLPPVTNNNDWDILSQYYESPFFFSAKVLAGAPPVYVELKKIYRQNEQQFIDLLNNVRHNTVTEDDYALLNSRYLPSFTPPPGERYITLTTHNRKADTINITELEKLPGKMATFSGSIQGEFSDKALPTDLELQLKEGAQVMFVKNDSSGERKFFNGKIGTVKHIREDKITVSFTNDDELVLAKETWRNVRYTYQKESNSIDEEQLGSFTQYPVRLAWAITIHKSQGLTFEKAIIDAGASFAAGQVYVALSRCTSLSGMVLLSRITPSGIATDQRVVQFSNSEAAESELQTLLLQHQQEYEALSLVKLFDWKKIVAVLNDWIALIPAKKLPDTGSIITLSTTILWKAEAQSVVAAKFQSQLTELFRQAKQTGDTSQLEERTGKAIGYFAKALTEELLQPLDEHISAFKRMAKVKKYLEEINATAGYIRQHLQKLVTATWGELVFYKYAGVYQQYLHDKQPAPAVTTPTAAPIEKKPAREKAGKAEKAEKVEKGTTHRESLALFREGKDIPAIAKLRNLALSTVSSHLALFVRSGELDIYELVNKEKADKILPVVKELGGPALGPIKQQLGDDFTWEEIRLVLHHWYHLQEQDV